MLAVVLMVVLLFFGGFIGMANTTAPAPIVEAPVCETAFCIVNDSYNTPILIP